MQIKKLAVAAAAVGALGASLLVASPASADYAPGTGDAVGVGSDTLQYLSDFVADGNFLASVGYNGAGNVNKVVSFDATADSNARLAYGAGGSGSSCAPGTGVSRGTGNTNANHSEAGNSRGQVCQLNETIVLRAGLKPVRRPNGSGAGANALKFDMVAGSKNIDYVRASGKQGSVFTAAGLQVGRITVGTEQFGMMTSLTTNATVPLTSAQLKNIYTANTGVVNGFGSTGCATWGDVGVSGPTATTPILPLVPQVGSGTRNFFLDNIRGDTLRTTGNCAVVVEENDPEAIDGSGNPANAIQPFSGARWNLYNGKKGAGTPAAPTSVPNAGANSIKYFTDPSCSYGDNTVDAAAGGVANVSCGVATSASGLAVPQTLNPNVVFQYGVTTWWSTTRDVYIYYRWAERDNATDAFQPGLSINLVRTLFDNECSGTAFGGVNLNTAPGNASCVSVGVPAHSYGPGGAPYYAGPGQALIASAGFTPQYAVLSTPATSTD